MVDIYSAVFVLKNGRCIHNDKISINHGTCYVYHEQSSFADDNNKVNINNDKSNNNINQNLLGTRVRFSGLRAHIKS